MNTEMSQGEKVGEFCGTPICTYSPFELELADALDRQKVILLNKAMGCSDSPSTAEVLPGEMICSDNCIRRETAAEATGREVYSRRDKKYGAEKLSDLCALYEIMEDYNNLRGEKSQSTPEELCAWLNAQENCSFKHTVTTDGEDKVLTATDKKGTVLYAFRYVEGLTKSYVGGDEIRPFEPPKYRIGRNSGSCVVECFVPTQEPAYREPVALKEWKDEGESKYIPTSNVSRITMGGTALFDLGDPRKEIELSSKETIKVSQTKKCEWYPDGENRCETAITHAPNKEEAGVCDACFALREKRVS